jgi:lipoate-protein ligase A
VRQRPDESPMNAAPLPAATWLAAGPSTVEEQLALDEALLEEAHEGLVRETVVRTWMATEPTVVLGSSSQIGVEIDLATCQRLGIRVVRRPSGGLTVVLGPGCLMWTVVTHHPLAAPAIEAIHAATLEPLAAALREAGRPVARRGTSDLAVVSEAGDRKVAGNALRVRRHGVLYHGTLLDRFDLDLVSQVLRHPPREPDYRGRRPHGTFLANLELGRDRIDAAVRAAFAATSERLTWPQDRVQRLVRERYADPGWTARLL